MIIRGKFLVWTRLKFILSIVLEQLNYLNLITYYILIEIPLIFHKIKCSAGSFFTIHILIINTRTTISTTHGVRYW